MLRQVARLVQMLLHKPWSSKQSTKATGKTTDSETKNGILCTSSSLTSLEDWDLTNNNIFLEKLKNKV